MSPKIKLILLGILCLGTLIGTSYLYNWTMAILVTFVLAYLSKGSRVKQK